MASLPIANDTSDLHGAEVVDSILLIPTHEIVRGERLREIDPVWAGALGRLMARDGQQTPVEVCRLPGRTDWLLVAGGHRHEGACIEGIAYLRAVVVSANRDDRRLREVNENLWRKGLDPIDRAAFMAEAVLIHKRRVGLAADAERVAKLNAVHLKEIEAEADGMLDTMSSIYGWTDEVGEQLGFASRTVRRDLYLYRRLAPSLIARLRDARHPVARNATQLRALAKLQPDAQADVVDALVGDGGWEPCATVAEAVKRTQPDVARAVAEPAAKRMSTILGTLKRMSTTERVGLFQSPSFHLLIPAEARDLLAPMLRSGDADVGDVAPAAPARAPVAADAQPGVSRPAPRDLRALVALIQGYLADHDPDWIIGKLMNDEGASCSFAHGTYELKLATVRATCTAGGAGLLKAWMRAAERRLPVEKS